MKFRQNGKPLVLTLMVGLMFLLTACPGGDGNGVPPTAVNNSYEVTVGQSLDIPAPGVLGNDMGADLEAVLEADAAGDLVLDADGSFTYTPLATATSDQFTYRARNDAGTSDIATVSITINPANGGGNGDDELEAEDDPSFTVNPGQPVTISNAQLLANDTVPAGATATVTVTDTDGELTDNMDGTYTYTAAADAAIGSTYTFTYTLTAGGETSDPATVTITVVDAPPAGTGEYDVNFQNEGADTPDGYIGDFGLPFGDRNGQTYGWVTIENNQATSNLCDLSDEPTDPDDDGNGRDRDIPDVPQLLDTFMHMQGATVLAREGSFNGVAQNCAWQIALPEGTYEVQLALGDPQVQAAPSTVVGQPYPAYQVSVESVVFPDSPYTPPNRASNPAPSNGDIAALFVQTVDPLVVTIGDEDGQGNGVLTITPTANSRNTKIAYVAISPQGEEEED